MLALALGEGLVNRVDRGDQRLNLADGTPGVRVVADAFEVGQCHGGLDVLVERFAVGLEALQSLEQPAPGGGLGLVEADDVVDVVGQVQPVVLALDEGVDELIAVGHPELLADGGDRTVDDGLTGVMRRGGDVRVALEVGLQRGQALAGGGDQAVLGLGRHLGKEVAVQLARALDAGGVGHLALEDRHVLEARRLGERLDGGLGFEVGAVHHQLDLAGHEEARDQQDNLPVGLPAPGDAGEAVDHLVQDHPGVAGLELEKLAQFDERERVALLAPERELALGGVVGKQDRLDLGDRVGVAVLKVAKLGIGVGDEVVAQLVEQAAGAGRLELDALTEGVEVALQHHGGELLAQAGAALAVFVLAVDEDVAQRRRGVAGLGAVDVLLDLAVEGELDVEALALREADQRPAIAFAAAQDGAGVVECVPVIP